MHKLILLAVATIIALANYNPSPIDSMVNQCSIDMATNSNLICD